MSSIRVRLCIERGRCCVKAEQYWMLVDTSSCKFIHDLEYLIRKKFFMGGHTTVLNLFLDDFLLPSHEKIAVIRDNDLIRVSEDKALPTFNREKLSNDKNENPKKRKLEDSICSKKKSKKRKYSSTKTKKEDMVPSKIPTESQTSLVMTKGQELSEFFHSLLNNSQQKISCAKTSAGSSTQTKKQKHVTKSLKKKFKSSALNCFFEKLNPSLDKRSKKGLPSAPSIPLSFKNKNYVEDVQNRNGIIKPKDVSGSNKKDGVTLHKKKSSSRNSSSSTSSSSQSSSDRKSDTDKKNTCNGDSASERNEPQEVLKPQTADPGVINKNKNQGVCLSKQDTRNHIRFDYDSEPANGITEKASLPSHDILPACPATSNNNGINGTPILSPIHKNTEHITDSTQKKLATENNPPKRSCSINNFRKDVYTYKSTVLESTRMENEPEDALSGTAVPANVPANVPEFKDFSKYQPLVGPPRVGETVAYRTLELSQSYTPEISQYKVGKVISFDPVLKSMKLKLTKNSLSRVTGDGNVSSKFELFDDNEEEEPTVPVEIPDEVEVYWTSMIDPRLVVEPANIS